MNRSHESNYHEHNIMNVVQCNRLNIILLICSLGKTVIRQVLMILVNSMFPIGDDYYYRLFQSITNIYLKIYLCVQYFYQKLATYNNTNEYLNEWRYRKRERERERERGRERKRRVVIFSPAPIVPTSLSNYI